MPKATPIEYRPLVNELSRRAAEQVFDDGLSDPLELPLLGHRVAALHDVSLLIERFEDAARLPAEQEAFSGERSRLRVLCMRRLALLRRSAETRARYREILTISWDCLAPVWADNSGLLRGLSRTIEGRLEGGAGPFEILDALHVATLPRWRIQVMQAWKHGRVVIAPSLLATNGGGVSALPDGTLIVSVPETPHATVTPRVRRPATRAANALAEVAVPARLAILAALFAPRDPEEIAYLLKLSAATVSEHLAVLRRRGLVEVRRVGGMTLYRARPGALAAHVAEAAARVERILDDPLGEMSGKGSE